MLSDSRRWLAGAIVGSGACDIGTKITIRHPELVEGSVRLTGHKKLTNQLRLRFLQDEEGVVAEGCVDLVVHGFATGFARGNEHRFVPLRRVKPVRIVGEKAEARAGVGKGGDEVALGLGGEVEVIDGARDVEIRIRVEALVKNTALVGQVALHGVIDAEGKALPG